MKRERNGRERERDEKRKERERYNKKEGDIVRKKRITKRGEEEKEKGKKFRKTKEQ